MVLVLKAIDCGILNLKKAITSKNVVFNESAMSTHAPIQSSQTSSVEVEHFIDLTPNVDAPIADNLDVDDNSTIAPQSSPIV